MRRDPQPTGGVAVILGPVAAMLAGGILSHFRDGVGAVNTAVLLTAIVVAASLAGRIPGLATAVSASLAYNFFHTRPYHSLRVGAARDIVTVVLLVLVGLAVSEISVWRRREHLVATRRLQQEAALEASALMLAQGARPIEMWTAIRHDLVEALDLAECEYEAGALPRLSPLGRSGALGASAARFEADGFCLPPEGVAVPVTYRDLTYGYINLVPAGRGGSPRETRRMAVALADQFAVALALEAAEHGVDRTG